MSNLEIGFDVTLDRPATSEERQLENELRRKAAIRLADHIAAQHPHPLDDDMPAIAGAVIARDPQVRAELAEALDALFGDNPPRRQQ
ncbi:hypothetical protein ACN2WE_05455 [Streptomyces sp. cg28]|uniref:hypothetical protein n=1 Tax=Streptomyces sp. cg28 TaxID=3403457 RepID=UPI003B21B66B